MAICFHPNLSNLASSAGALLQPIANVVTLKMSQSIHDIWDLAHTLPTLKTKYPYKMEVLENPGILTSVASFFSLPVAEALPLKVDAFPPQFNVDTLNGKNGFIIDGASPPLSSAGDINGDGVPDMFTTVNQNGVVIFGSNKPWNEHFNVKTLDGSNGFFIIGTTPSSVAPIGDFNGDGYDDLAIGNYWAETVSVIFGGKGPWKEKINASSLNGKNGFVFTTQEFNYPTNFGYSVSGLGDFNADGLPDLVVGAPNLNVGSFNSVGAAFFLFGSKSPWPSQFSASSLDGTNGFMATGDISQSNVQTGYSVGGGGDVNGDRIPDAIVGAPGDSGGIGSAYVMFGSGNYIWGANESFLGLNGQNGFWISAFGTNPSPPAINIGYWVGNAGDLNSDGYDGVIVAAPDASQAFIVFGSNWPWSSQVNVENLENFGITLSTESTEPLLLGQSAAPLGDVNGDGYDDLLISAPELGGWGSSFVVYGRSVEDFWPSNLVLTSLNGTDGFMINTAMGFNGVGVAGPGDVNGDGLNDLMVGNATIFGQKG